MSSGFADTREWDDLLWRPKNGILEEAESSYECTSPVSTRPERWQKIWVFPLQRYMTACDVSVFLRPPFLGDTRPPQSSSSPRRRKKRSQAGRTKVSTILR